jgi:hypothetical protein
MKIKEVTNEGFVSSLAKGLLPEPVQKVIDTPYKQKAEISDNQAAQQAYKMYGVNPEFDQRRFNAMLADLPDDLKQEYQSKMGQMSYYTDWQMAQVERNIGAIAARHQAYLDKVRDDNKQMKKGVPQVDNMLLKSRPAQTAQAMLAKNIFGQGKPSQGKNVSSATAGSQPVGNPANDPSKKGQA